MILNHIKDLFIINRRNVAIGLSDLLDTLNQWPGGRMDLTAAGGLARLRFNRPDKSNCLSGQMMMELKNRVQELPTMLDCGVVILEGVGESFCSGADLGLINQLCSPSLGVALFHYMSDALAQLRSAPQISIARLCGYTLGGATEIAASCDIRVAHRNAKIGFLQSRMGIVPSWGGASYIENLVGRANALHLMTAAPILSAHEAKNIGFIDVVYENDNEFEEFTMSLVKCGVEITRAQKAMLDANQQGRNKQNEVIRSVWGSPAQKDAIRKQLSNIIKKN